MIDVAAAIVFVDGNVMLTRRATGEKHAGWWEFPGGKVEVGESPETCLRRELMEELGVDAKIGEKLAESIYSYATGAIRLMAFQVEILSGDLCLRVHDELQWVNVSDLRSFMLLPADIPIAIELAKKI